MKVSLAIIVSATLAIPLGVEAQQTESGYKAVNGTQVVQSDGASFEVFQGSENSSGASFWCGAGDYVLSELDEPDDTPIYVIRPLDETLSVPGERSIQFTIEPTDALADKAVDAADAEVSKEGDKMTAFAAKNLCSSDS